MNGATSDPAELLRRLRASGRSVEPASGMLVVPTDAVGNKPGRPAADACTTTGALLRATEDAAAALAAADPDLARERAETAAGLRAEAPAPARAGGEEALPNGTRLYYCRVCGRLAAWGFGAVLDRGRDGSWFCFKHRGRAG